LCVPYFPPAKENVSLEEQVKTRLPNFAYQLQLKSGKIEPEYTTKEQINQFLTALYGGRTEAGQPGFDVSTGFLLDRIGKLKPSPLLNEAVSIIHMRKNLLGTSSVTYS
jgi:hypothetical protein